MKGEEGGSSGEATSTEKPERVTLLAFPVFLLATAITLPYTMVERVFPVESPLVTKVEIKMRGFVRRSRLYYLRDLSGKKARLHAKVRDLSGLI